MGTFKSQLKNTDYYWNDYKDDRPLHSLLGHSSFKWKKLTSFIGTFKIQLEKTVQYPNDFKDDRTLHHLWGHSNSNWKRQFSIETISRITELYILWGEIQIPTEKDSLVLKWLIEMITKMTEPYILWGDIQIPIDRTSQLLLGHSNSTGKNSSVRKWFQKWQKLASFFGTLKFQLKKTVQDWNDFKYHRTLHPLWDIQIPTENNSLLLKW